MTRFGKARASKNPREQPPMWSAQEAYAGLIKTRFAPALRDQGLKGSGGRFALPSETTWTQLGFQKSAYSTALSLRFTVNLSSVDRATWAEKLLSAPWLGAQPSPNTGYGVWHQYERIGRLMPSGNDHWWTLDRGTDLEGLALEVNEALATYAVPWLRERVGAA